MAVCLHSHHRLKGKSTYTGALSRVSLYFELFNEVKASLKSVFPFCWLNAGGEKTLEIQLGFVLYILDKKAANDNHTDDRTFRYWKVQRMSWAENHHV